MTRAEIVSLNIGKPQPLMYNNKEVESGIRKQPAGRPLLLSRINLDGDGQADLVHHGGKDKAVCVYPYEHYPYWEQELGTTLDFGAFGENLTTRGLLETDVCIGDTFQLGEAVVQITQPRQPCYKLAARYQVPDMPIKVQDTGFTGYYFRVLEEGTVFPTSELTLLTRHPLGVTVDFANRIMHHDKKNVDGIKRLLEVKELSESWRATLTKRLEGQDVNTRERLQGN
ncbi:MULTISPECIES: MOSC domain-containing protein [Paenibacillus]|uniref:MOSC domain-containing protein n=1 Tax=Paenibacillus TaxID=44249 RepID=UPI002FE013A1